MRIRHLVAIIAMVMGVAGGTASAADIGNLSGQSCGADTGDWHFINNQIPRGSGLCTLTATFSSGVIVTGPSQVNRRTQHFDIVATGTLHPRRQLLDRLRHA